MVAKTIQSKIATRETTMQVQQCSAYTPNPFSSTSSQCRRTPHLDHHHMHGGTHHGPQKKEVGEGLQVDVELTNSIRLTEQKKM